MEKEIIELQKKLNSYDFLPSKAYRRNTKIYELVCYVNNVTGCYLSGNFSPIKIFIERANLFMSDSDNQLSDTDEYYALVSGYLSLIEKKTVSKSQPFG